MKYQLSLATVAALAQYASAFPMMDLPGGMRAALAAAPLEKRGGGISGTSVPDPAQLTGTFNAKAQYVSNKGQYKWVAPGPNDQRGPCPGLNAMANHGYIPHNGVATIAQYVQGTFDVFGMGLDLGAFLAVLGAELDGNLLSWSIGGPTGLLSGDGLIGSHNKYESDVSPVRPDLYEYGNNYEVNMDQWKAFYAMQAGVSDKASNYNLDVLQKFRSNRFDQSIANNPYFFNGPFTGVLVQPAAYTFIYRFMANKSAEHPDGQLTKSVVKDFFGITENSDGSFTGGLGQERIPDNWYKRAIGDEYTIPFFLEDVVQEASVYPKFLNVGGNTGKVNTFSGVDVTNLSGGGFNSATLLQGNNLFCFAYQFAQQSQPDLLKSLGSVAGGAAATAIESLGCPQLNAVDGSQLSKFPGYTKSGSVV